MARRIRDISCYCRRKIGQYYRDCDCEIRTLSKGSHRIKKIGKFSTVQAEALEGR